jgi:hypothetical protein
MASGADDRTTDFMLGTAWKPQRRSTTPSQPRSLRIVSSSEVTTSPSVSSIRSSTCRTVSLGSARKRWSEVSSAVPSEDGPGSEGSSAKGARGSRR